jgi:hypothetical protein
MCHPRLLLPEIQLALFEKFTHVRHDRADCYPAKDDKTRKDGIGFVVLKMADLRLKFSKEDGL